MLNRFTTAKYIWNLRLKTLGAKNKLLKKIYKWRYGHTLIYLGSYLPFSAQFDEMPTFPQGIHGIFVSQGAKIRKGCTIFQ